MIFSNFIFLQTVNNHQHLLVNLLERTEQTLIQTSAYQLSTTLVQFLFSFDQDKKVEKTLIHTLAYQLSSTLMQLLFSFHQDIRVKKTCIQSLARQLSCNSYSNLNRIRKLRNLSHKLSLVNSRATISFFMI